MLHPTPRPPLASRRHGRSARAIGTCLALLLACAPLAAQRDGRLEAFEGLYEYEQGQVLHIAASPVEPMLVAIIDGAHYPLRPEGRDTFRTAGGDRVRFAEGPDGMAYSYLNRDTTRRFRRLSTDVHFPRRMWYPRLPEEAASSELVTPADRNDGIPTGRLADSSLDPARIEDMFGRLVAGRYPDVHAILVAQDDTLVLEEYFYEYDADTPHQMRSATKSIASILIGIAIDQGLIGSVGDPVLPYFAQEYPTLANMSAWKQQITIEDLLTHRSGLACDDRDPASPGNELRIYPTADWIRYVLELPSSTAPGSEAHYCSGGVHVLKRLIELVSDVPLEQFANAHLFGPLGMRHVPWTFEPNASHADTFGQVWLRPREMLQIGLLFHHEGRWQGRQVVPAAWVAASTASHTIVDDTEYGYLWWRPYLNVPGGRHDGLMATGNGGQKIYVWPELDMIVVMTGGNYNVGSPANELLIDYILPPRPAAAR